MGVELLTLDDELGGLINYFPPGAVASSLVEINVQENDDSSSNSDLPSHTDDVSGANNGTLLFQL